MRGFSWRDSQVDISLGAKRGADRPEVETGDRNIGGLLHAAQEMQQHGTFSFANEAANSSDISAIFKEFENR